MGNWAFSAAHNAIMLDFRLFEWKHFSALLFKLDFICAYNVLSSVGEQISAFIINFTMNVVFFNAMQTNQMEFWKRCWSVQFLSIFQLIYWDTVIIWGLYFIFDGKTKMICSFNFLGDCNLIVFRTQCQQQFWNNQIYLLWWKMLWNKPIIRWIHWIICCRNMRCRWHE